MVVDTYGGGGGVRVFKLALLPAHPAQMPVLINNVTVQDGEDHTRHNGQRVLPIQKGQGWQVHIIACPHLCRSPRGVHLGRRFFIYAADAAVALGGTATFLPPSCEKVRQGDW